MSSMFDFLMELPLFQGVSRQVLSDVIGSAKFHFLKYPAGETIIRKGEPCTHLTFIIGGKVRAEITNHSGRFTVLQTLEAPAILSPEFMFGKHTDYPATVTALDDVSVLKLSKADYMTILETDRVFLFNYLNVLAVNAQKSVEGILSLSDGALDERIAFWVSAMTRADSTDIRLLCRKRDLCSMFGSPRAVFNNTLDAMQARGILEYNDNELHVLDRKQLVALLNPNHEEEE